MNPIWVENPREWKEMDIIDQLKYLMQYTYTGPCGQSSHVLAQRTATRETLGTAIKTIQAYREFINNLERLLKSDN